MPDQATQLRQLIRDVKTNPSPGIALPPVVAVVSAQSGVETAQIAFELATALSAMQRKVLLVGADSFYCRPPVNDLLSIAAVTDVSKLYSMHDAGQLPVSVDVEMMLVDGEDADRAQWLRNAHQIVLAMPPTTEAVVESYALVKRLAEEGVVTHEQIRPILVDYAPAAVASKLLKQFASTCDRFLNLRVASGSLLGGVDRQQTLQATATLAHELATECLTSANRLPNVHHTEANQEIQENLRNQLNPIPQN
ncbi:MinD/ParA family ATP-binding protein [Adhaeretor mobilis]|uniref:Uncharacterized protein n=1 Tax=Adhaeretor mobilis TaxID=1930276 RepID=A0A517MYX0_9BACT|nr:hypothetical protein [Adhaeretor mobilis]QDT00067.1 hypothetical protein HG15A2_34020 [Adhaeretor mobilis]